jgi:NADPH2:quinone reductase
MKAVVCTAWGEPEQLQVQEIDNPLAGVGELIVQVKAAAANFPDLLVVRNQYQAQPVLPYTPGRELAGVVIGRGAGVEGFAIGTRVFASQETGAFAEQARVHTSRAIVLPDNIDFDAAAALTVTYGTSYHALLDRAQLRAGETVLVLGAAGGVGLAAVDIAKAVGARVIAAVSSREKAEVCRAYGADATVIYTEEDLRAAVKSFTDGRGVDVVYDPVGGKFSEPAFRSIAWRGRYLVVGFADGEVASLRLNLPLLKGASLVGVFWGEYSRREPAAFQADMQVMMGWLQSGRLRPHIAQRYSLAEAGQALRALANRTAIGKLVVCPDLG